MGERAEMRKKIPQTRRERGRRGGGKEGKTERGSKRKVEAK